MISTLHIYKSWDSIDSPWQQLVYHLFGHQTNFILFYVYAILRYTYYITDSEHYL